MVKLVRTREQAPGVAFAAEGPAAAEPQCGPDTYKIRKVHRAQEKVRAQSGKNGPGAPKNGGGQKARRLGAGALQPFPALDVQVGVDQQGRQLGCGAVQGQVKRRKLATRSIKLLLVI